MADELLPAANMYETVLQRRAEENVGPTETVEDALAVLREIVAKRIDTASKMMEVGFVLPVNFFTPYPPEVKTLLLEELESLGYKIIETDNWLFPNPTIQINWDVLDD